MLRPKENVPKRVGQEPRALPHEAEGKSCFSVGVMMGKWDWRTVSLVAGLPSVREAWLEMLEHGVVVWYEQTLPCTYT